MSGRSSGRPPGRLTRWCPRARPAGPGRRPADRPRRAVDGAGALRRRLAGVVSRRLQLPPRPARRRAPRDDADVVAALAVCRAHGVPVLPVGGGRRSPVRRRIPRVVLDFTRHLNRSWSSTRTRAPRRRARRGLRRAPRRRRPARADLRPRPVHPQPLHARRDDRQQRLRRRTRSPGARPSTTSQALDVLTYRGERLSLGPRGAGRVPDRAARAGRRGSARGVRTGFPDLPAGSPATTSTSCCPSTGRPGPGAGRHRGHVRGARRRRSGWSRRRPLARWPCSASRTPGPRPTTCPSCASTGPLTVEGMDADLVAALRARHPVERRRGRCRRAAPGSSWRPAARRAPRRRRRRTPSRAAVRRRSARGGEGPARSARCGGSARTAPGIVDPAARTAARPGRAGRTPPCRRRGSAPTCGSSRAAGRHGLRGSAYGHFGEGCVHVRIDFDLLTAPGVAASARS